jgi:hypothetical protein
LILRSVTFLLRVKPAGSRIAAHFREKPDLRTPTRLLQRVFIGPAVGGEVVVNFERAARLELL